MSDSESDPSDYEDIRPFFTIAQWREMVSYEKSSYRSAKDNYHAMQAAGEWKMKVIERNISLSKPF